jgi:hypothetical protein
MKTSAKKIPEVSAPLAGFCQPVETKKEIRFLKYFPKINEYPSFGFIVGRIWS